MPQRDNRPTYRYRGHERPTASIRASVLSPKADDDGVAEILLYDPIDSWGEMWGVSAKEFVDGLSKLDDDVSEIRLRINSPGGECFEAIAMMNALRNHPARVVAVVDGLAASAASVLACAADELVMGRNTQLMIHDASGGCWGPAALMHDTADRLDKLSDNLADVYAAKAGTDAADFRAAMLAETWYSPEEAVAAGLADRVEGVEPSDEQGADQARFDLSVFAYSGRLEAPAPTLPVAPAARATPPAATATGDTTLEGRTAMADITDEQLTTLRQSVGVSDDADIDTILEALAEVLDEQAADPPSNAAASLPEGTVVVDAAALAALQADARAGAEARAVQVREDREKALDDAVRTGRIAPAARGSWAALLEKSPSEAATLASLAPTIAVDEEYGHVGETPLSGDPKAEDLDKFYATIYGAQGAPSTEA